MPSIPKYCGVWVASAWSSIQEWVERVDYNPKKHLPKPANISVGPDGAWFADTDEDFEAAMCALMFEGVDGTTHGR